MWIPAFLGWDGRWRQNCLWDSQPGEHSIVAEWQERPCFKLKWKERTDFWKCLWPTCVCLAPTFPHSQMCISHTLYTPRIIASHSYLFEIFCCFLIIVETASLFVDQADLDLIVIHQPLPPKCWNCVLYTQPHLRCFLMWINKVFRLWIHDIQHVYLIHYPICLANT